MSFPSFAEVSMQGSLRTRLEVWDWFEGNANSDYAFSGNLLRVSIAAQRPAFDWQIELAAPFFLGLPNDAVAPGNQGQLGLGATYFVANKRRRNASMVFPKQGFLRLKNLFGDNRQSLRLGRFEFSDGAEVAPADATLAAVKRDRISQRLIGPFGWSHVGRSFDGAHYIHASQTTNFTLLAALPTRGAFQADGWGNLKIGLLYAALTRQVAGTRHNGEWRAFGMYSHDWRNVPKVDDRPASIRNTDRANIRIGTFGGHYLHSAKTAAGLFDVTLWGALQAGRWGRLDHAGNSYAVEAGWQPTSVPKLQPWLRAGYSRSSGDGDPNDSEHATFFQALPTPRPYARFPFFNMMNNEDAFVELVLRPSKAISIRSDVHSLRLTEAADLWYLGGGAFQPWTFGFQGRTSAGTRGLATLYDISADYAVHKNLALSAYFGHAVGHSVARSVYPGGKDANFGYLEMTVRF
ncbi:MAG TPA: alginate export family protein [Bryobacteraceae bacterium]|nr:alginate export family protein [Bryobacteraceae bacterium]